MMRRVSSLRRKNSLSEKASCDHAASGQEALEKLGGESPQVVILDVKMPGMDGVAVLKRSRAGTHGAGGHAHRSRHSGIRLGGAKVRGNGLPDEAIDIDELIAKAEEAFTRWQIMEEKIRVAEGRAPDKK